MKKDTEVRRLQRERQKGTEPGGRRRPGRDERADRAQV